MYTVGFYIIFVSVNVIFYVMPPSHSPLKIGMFFTCFFFVFIFKVGSVSTLATAGIVVAALGSLASGVRSTSTSARVNPAATGALASTTSTTTNAGVLLATVAETVRSRRETNVLPTHVAMGGPVRVAPMAAAFIASVQSASQVAAVNSTLCLCLTPEIRPFPGWRFHWLWVWLPC